MASVDEMNAGFDVLNALLHKIVSELVPGFMQGAAMKHLEDQQGRGFILQGVRDVLKAAEDVRTKQPK